MSEKTVTQFKKFAQAFNAEIEQQGTSEFFLLL
jgi:hypothetical protein